MLAIVWRSELVSYMHMYEVGRLISMSFTTYRFILDIRWRIFKIRSKICGHLHVGIMCMRTVQMSKLTVTPLYKERVGKYLPA